MLTTFCPASRSVCAAGVLWGKHDGDGKQLQAWQSMISGFSAAILGPTVTNPFDVIKVRPLVKPLALCTTSVSM